MKNLLIIALLVLLSHCAHAQKIEAENFSSMSGVKTETTADASGGMDVGSIDASDWTEYLISPAVAGSYLINLRVAKPYGDPGEIDVRDSAGNNLAIITPTVTGGWQTWNTFSGKISLPAGSQKLRLFYKIGNINVNWFELVPPSVSSTTPMPVPATTVQMQIDALNAAVSALQAQLITMKPFVLYLKASNLGGKNTPTDPYYFIPTPPATPAP